uniref:Uncharacterized protein n=1 Tax=Amorphochlora amoebiformis TaxID=1561963 RepID=A0A7S0DI55_9EUKA|mmetsp:Transcript_25946/g.41085  ORF Transcript_25946/g.41085 Transcript_25946/m.41085 type:complete len:701 (+) Transcript_25946:58-2160(+)
MKNGRRCLRKITKILPPRCLEICRRNLHACNLALSLRVTRRSILGFCLVVFALISAYVSLGNVISDNSPIIPSNIQNHPKKSNRLPPQNHPKISNSQPIPTSQNHRNLTEQADDRTKKDVPDQFEHSAENRPRNTVSPPQNHQNNSVSPRQNRPIKTISTPQIRSRNTASPPENHPRDTVSENRPQLTLRKSEDGLKLGENEEIFYKCEELGDLDKDFEEEEDEKEVSASSDGRDAIEDPRDKIKVKGKYLPTNHGECLFRLEKSLSYLPNPLYLQQIHQNPPASWETDADSLRTYIEKLQNPKDCRKPLSRDKGRWHLLKLTQPGVGYNLFQFADLFARHIEMGISVIINENNYWRFTDYNCTRGYTCHWRSLTECRLKDIPQDTIIALTHQEIPPTLNDVCGGHGEWTPKKGRCLCDEGYIANEAGGDETGCRKVENEQDKHLDSDSLSEKMNDFLPWGLSAPGEVAVEASECGRTFDTINDYRHKQGYLWWHAVHLEWLVTGAKKYPQTKAWATSRGLDHKNGKTCIAVHVRNGDACMDPLSSHRTCHPWVEYLAEIEKIEKLYGKQKTIFIATDNQTVIEDAISHNSAGRRLVYQNISRAKYNPREIGDTVDIRQDLDDPEVVTEFMTEVVGLSMCGYFIGTFTSSVAWITVELQAMRLGHYRPFIGLDMAYGHNRNVGRFDTYRTFVRGRNDYFT